jgi:hypothetical protein
MGNSAAAQRVKSAYNLPPLPADSQCNSCDVSNKTLLHAMIALVLMFTGLIAGLVWLNDQLTAQITITVFSGVSVLFGIMAFTLPLRAQPYDMPPV